MTAEAIAALIWSFTPHFAPIGGAGDDPGVEMRRDEAVVTFREGAFLEAVSFPAEMIARPEGEVHEWLLKLL